MTGFDNWLDLFMSTRIAFADGYEPFSWAVGLLSVHLMGRVRRRPHVRLWAFVVHSITKLLACAIALLGCGWTIYLLLDQSKVPIGLFIGVTVLFGVAVYVLLAEFMLEFGAKRLNAWHKGKWIKEIEYPYVLLGTVGLYVAINRLDIIEGGTRKFDLLGPMLIVAAVAVKLIKVRAETNDWDKI
jgi:hypothetical protein